MISQTEEYLVQLRSLVGTNEKLKKHGYVTQYLTDEELLLKQRCLGCGKTMSQLRLKGKKNSKPAAESQDNDGTLSSLGSTSLPTCRTPNIEDNPGGANGPPKLICRFHPGRVVEKHWTCCSQHVSNKPCGGSCTHTPRSQLLAELIKQHQYHFTPDDIEVRDVHAAVAIDCEMGTAMSGDSELIQVTLIDYFSGAVLINNFVQPDVPMQHLNTRFSGVSWLDINEAKKQGTCLAGKAGARAAIWKYVGLDTIVVGHGASNDLRALRWIHGLVVDSFVLEYCYLKEKEGSEDEEKKASGKEEEGRARDILRTSMETLSLSEIKLPGNNTTTTPQKRTRSTPGRLSLKTLSKQHMGRDIQMAGNKGHDSLEDAIAAKDLVHWSIMHADRMSYHSTN